MALKALENNIVWSDLEESFEKSKLGKGSQKLRGNNLKPLKKRRGRKLKKKGEISSRHSKASKSKKKSKSESSDTAYSFDSHDEDDDEHMHHDDECPDPNSGIVPCAPTDLHDLCDKYHGGDFRSCYEACKPSFCCIHDSKSTSFAPSCSREVNCMQYDSCYIVWWKLHDTVGPANYIQVEQDDEFFNMNLQDIQEDLPLDPIFFAQLFGHHFDTDDEPTDDRFTDSENW